MNSFHRIAPHRNIGRTASISDYFTFYMVTTADCSTVSGSRRFELEAAWYGRVSLLFCGHLLYDVLCIVQLQDTAISTSTTVNWTLQQLDLLSVIVTRSVGLKKTYL